MGKSIIYKGKQYILDTKETRKEFFEDLTETKDEALFAYLNYTIYRQKAQNFYKKHILAVLNKMNLEKDSELYSLRGHCYDFVRMVEAPTIFMILYYRSRELFDKYLPRLSEKTALQVAARVVKKYISKQNRSSGIKYPLPYIKNGELFLLTEQLDAMYDNETQDIED